MCSGNDGPCLCDSWVFCGNEEACGSKFGECWLKKQKDVLVPDRQEGGQKVMWTSGLIFVQGEICDLKPYKNTWRIRVKILKVWKQSSSYGETLEVILCDSKGDKISACVKKQNIAKFKPLLSEGETKIIANFSVGPTVGAYKSTEHNYKLCFFQYTHVGATDALPLELSGLKFARFEDILSGKLGIEFLVDVIGQIVSIGELQTFTSNNRENKKLTLELRNEDDTRLSCTLFGCYADKVNGYVSLSNDTNLIIVLQFGRISLWKDVWSVSNAFNCTTVYMNSPPKELAEFRSKLPNDQLQLATVETNRPMSITCTSMKDEFMLKTPRKTIREITNANEEGKCVVMAKVLSIISDMGWYYLSCKKCSRKVQPIMQIDSEETAHLFYCEKCDSTVKEIVPRFMLHLRVSDGNADAKFLIFDRDAMQILNMTAAELTEQFADDAPDVPPPPIQMLEGKMFLFIVNVERNNVVWKHETYRVHRIAHNKQMIEEFATNGNLCIGSVSGSGPEGGGDEEGSHMVSYSAGVNEPSMAGSFTPVSKRKVSEEPSDGSTPESVSTTSTTKKICAVKIKEEKSG